MVQEGPIQYHELNSSLMLVYQGWWNIGIEGKGGLKRKGSRFWEKKNETKILYLARANALEPKEVQNIGF